MDAPGDIWSAEIWPSGWTVRRVAETGSTNTDLAEAVSRGRVGDRTALVTGHQTAGRGRLDRTWDAPPGTNLLVSLFLAGVPDKPALLTQRVALAAAEAVESLVSGVRVDLKWPNDLLLDERKLAGILAQRTADGVVVGLGLNVGWSPPEAADLGARVAPSRILVRLLEGLDTMEDDVADVYRARLATRGQTVRVELPGDRVLYGTALDVDDAGRLVVDDGEQRHHLDAGDIVHVRPGNHPI